MSHVFMLEDGEGQSRPRLSRGSSGSTGDRTTGTAWPPAYLPGADHGELLLSVGCVPQLQVPWGSLTKSRALNTNLQPPSIFILSVLHYLPSTASLRSRRRRGADGREKVGVCVCGRTRKQTALLVCVAQRVLVRVAFLHLNLLEFDWRP